VLVHLERLVAAQLRPHLDVVLSVLRMLECRPCLVVLATSKDLITPMTSSPSPLVKVTWVFLRALASERGWVCGQGGLVKWHFPIGFK
jgi:hypothetical protein